MLNCKKVETSIRRAKKQLEQEAEKNGIYENFGQKELRQIKDKFIDSSDYSDEMNSVRDKIDEFNEWCMWYRG